MVHALATTRGMAAAKPELMVSVTRAIYRAQRLIHNNRKATVDALITSGAAGPDRPMIEAIVSVYAPAVPQSPRISLQGIERDAELYPAHPRAPDFTRVKAADFVAAQFAEEAMKAAP
jgi:ABC-type nitrate/sulfonate/bicarbonate transport system substrate-binding protein